MVHLNFTTIKSVEVVSESFTFRPILRFEGETPLPMSPHAALETALALIKDFMLLGEYTLNMHDNQCEECFKQIYEKLRTMTVEQLRDLVWQSDAAQEVLTEKLKEQSGMPSEHEQKWDAAMSVVKVG